MINAFKSGLRGALFYLVVFFILFFLIQFFFPSDQYSTCINPLNNFFGNIGLLKIRYAVFIMNWIPLLLSVRFLTKMVVSYSFIDKNNFFPVFILLLHLGLTARSFFDLNLRYWAFFLMLYSYYFIIITYKKEKSKPELFSSGFFTLLTIYVDPFFLFLFPLIIISLFSFRALNSSDMISFVSGSFFSLVIVEFFLHCIDMVGFYPFVFIINYRDVFAWPLFSPDSFIVFTFIFILLNFSIFYLSLQTTGLSVFMGKNRQMMIYWAFFAFFSFFIRCNLWEYLFLPILLPFSVLTGETIYHIKNKKLQSLLFYGLFSIYVFHFLFSREIIKFK